MHRAGQNIALKKKKKKVIKGSETKNEKNEEESRLKSNRRVLSTVKLNELR